MDGKNSDIEKAHTTVKNLVAAVRNGDWKQVSALYDSSSVPSSDAKLFVEECKQRKLLFERGVILPSGPSNPAAQTGYTDFIISLDGGSGWMPELHVSPETGKITGFTTHDD